MAENLTRVSFIRILRGHRDDKCSHKNHSRSQIGPYCEGKGWRNLPYGLNIANWTGSVLDVTWLYTILLKVCVHRVFGPTLPVEINHFWASQSDNQMRPKRMSPKDFLFLTRTWFNPIPSTYKSK